MLRRAIQYVAPRFRRLHATTGGEAWEMIAEAGQSIRPSID